MPKSFSLAYKFVSNILNVYKRNDNSFVLPVRIPMNEQTAIIFGYSFDPKISFDISQTFSDCALQLNGSDFWQGAVTISSISSIEINIIFRFASGYIPSVNLKNNLKDFFRERYLNITGNTTNYYAISWPDTDIKHESYKVTINNSEFLEITSEQNTADYYLQQLALKINHPSVVGVTYDQITNNMVIQSAINTPLEVTANYVVQNTSTVLNRIVTARSEFIFTSLEGQGTVYELPPMYLPNLFDSKAINFTGFVNIHEVNKLYSLPTYINDIETTLVPCIKSKWMIQQIFGDFGIDVIGDYLSDPETSQRLEFVPRSIDPEVFSTNFSSGLNIQISIAEFLPDISLSDWISSLKKESCMSITFDPVSKVASFNLVENVLNNKEYTDWSEYVVKLVKSTPTIYRGHRIGYTVDKEDQLVKQKVIDQKTYSVAPSVSSISDLQALSTPQLEEIRYVSSKNSFYKYKAILNGSNVEIDWFFYAYNLDDHIDKEEETEIRSPYMPMVDADLNLDGKSLRLPSSEVAGFMPQLDLTDNKFKPKFTIYRGLQPDGLGGYYRMASTNIYNGQENIIPNASKVFSPGVSEFSQFQQMFKSYIDVQSKNNVDHFLLDLPHHEIITLNQQRKIRINGVNYLILSLSGEIHESGLGTIQAEMQRLP